ncbi:MAG TPA: type I-F CRISPR-associated protein Csy3 [Vicinamibacterales bacterium]|jgi:CRISPR-associated protein Csy3
MALKTATVLAFERKLDPSDALFFAGRWEARASDDAWQPIAVREKSVRGTISNRLKAKDQDPAKLDAAVENPNLQKVDVATLPNTTDTLRVSFTLRVLAGTGVPSACNNSEYRARLLAVVNRYAEEHGFDELAHRYAINLANGRFLWRNRIGAEQLEVRVAQLRDGALAQKWTFNSLAFSLRNFEVPSTDTANVDALAGVIANGFSGPQSVLLSVTAFVRIGTGQEVFPSQELFLNKEAGKKSKTLYSVSAVAGMHSQKIGNAIRTIDTWHPESEEFGPIAVEPYGSVTTLGKACRQPKSKQDFYSLLDNWILKDNAPEMSNQHFVVATLIRGGVFGDSGKE